MSYLTIDLAIPLTSPSPPLISPSPAAYSELHAQVPTSDTHRQDQSRQDLLRPAKDRRQIQHTHLPGDTVHGSNCLPESAGECSH